MINWLITMFTEWLMLIYYFHLSSRSNKSKITHYGNSCWMPILSFNTRVVQPKMMACGDVETERIWEHLNDFLSTCPKPFSWAKNRRTIFFYGKSRGTLIAFIWDHDREKRGNDQVELLIVKQILLVSSLWNV